MRIALSKPTASEPAPRFVTTGLSEKERDATATLARSLGGLDNYVRDFHAALALFDFAEAQALNSEAHDTIQWCFIACRDGAMTIYHFGQTLQYVREALRSCPTIKSLVDPKLLRLTSKKFDARFPDFIPLRNAIAHRSELWKNVANSIKNALTGVHTGPPIVVANLCVEKQVVSRHGGLHSLTYQRL